MRFGTLVRGNGKVFVVIEESVDSGSFEVTSVLGSGETVPAVVVRSDSGPILVCAALDREQHVNVRVLDGDGLVMDEGRLRIGARSSRVISRLNTLIRDELSAMVRNVDIRPIPGESHLEIKGLHDDLAPEMRADIVRGEVRFIISSGSPVGFPVDIRAFDRDGGVIQGSWTILGDEVRDLADGSKSREVCFSLRVPHDLESFGVWASTDAPGIADGFEWLDPSMTDLRRRQDGFKRFVSPIGPTYDQWFRRHRTSDRDLEIQRRQRFSTSPLFSIIVPLFKTPLPLFHEMVDSVVDQTYPNWELILVNASPEDEGLRRAVACRCAEDERIKSLQLEGNLGITLNTNAGIEAAEGEFMCFFDHDDTLEPDILFRYMEGLERYPDTDLFYCDEDKLLDGRYVEAYFKPDFNWDQLYSNNYVCHLLTVRSSLVRAMDELPGSQYDGSQDHNLTLVVAERARNIYHARRPLYHWRIHPGSTAAGPGEKPWTQESGRIAVQEHFDRIGIDADVIDSWLPNNYLVNYEIPALATVDIIIPNKDEGAMLTRCIETIEEMSTFRRFRIIVVENNSIESSTFETYEQLKGRYDNLSVIDYGKASFNFSALCNLGASKSDAPYLLFLNNDTEVREPQWIERLLGPLQQEQVWASGARLLYPDELIQHAGVIVPQSAPQHLFVEAPADTTGYFALQCIGRDLSAVTGACLMVRRDRFEGLGGFDEGFPVSYNDVDLCLRIREAGGQIAYDPRATLIHHESVSRGSDYGNRGKFSRLVESRAKLFSRFPEYRALDDPFYSYNCAPDRFHYELS